MDITAETAVDSREYFATVNGCEYSVEIQPRAGDQGGYWWVTVKVYQPDLKWWRSVLSESAYDSRNDMDALRSAFKQQREKMKRWLDSWLMHRASAAEEHGGKRGYYTKHANQAHKWILEYAAHWRLCKALWKEITRL